MRLSCLRKNTTPRCATVESCQHSLRVLFRHRLTCNSKIANSLLRSQNVIDDIHIKKFSADHWGRVFVSEAIQGSGQLQWLAMLGLAVFGRMMYAMVAIWLRKNARSHFQQDVLAN